MFFQSSAKIEMAQKKIGYLVAILKQYNILKFFFKLYFRIAIFYSTYIMVQISL